MKTYITITFVAFILFIGTGCKKEFLDEKPSKALLVPTTLADFQALLDNTAAMNMVPGIQRLGDGILYTTPAGLKGYRLPAERNSYIWASDIFQGTQSTDWNVPYREVFYSNIVLDGLKAVVVDNSSKAEFNQVQGSALFYRAHAFFNLAQLFARPYTSSAGKDPGIPMPLTSDINIKSGRGTLDKVYAQIIKDLLASVPLLPLNATLKSRPSQSAAFALLARVYLAMGDYNNSLLFAGKCLAQKNKLLDYSTFDTTSSSPFPGSLPNGNDEVLFHAISPFYSFNSSSVTGIDTVLLSSYAPNDLRRILFFYNDSAPYISFNNDYAGSAGLFAGITIDEMYLTRAECYARLGDVSDALGDLNNLLITRFRPGTFTPFTAVNADAALKLILTERKKELVMNKGILQWMDLRRLNLDPRFAVTLTRTLDGSTYSLPPNDKRYVYPIPDNEITTNNLVQNPR